MTRRKATLVPWYHEKKDQCEVDTVAGSQCKNSASYIAKSGMNGSSEKLPVCKPHGDMLMLDPDVKWVVSARKTRIINI